MTVSVVEFKKMFYLFVRVDEKISCVSLLVHEMIKLQSFFFFPRANEAVKIGA